MQRPDVHEILDHCRKAGLHAPKGEIVFYLGRMRLLSSGASPMLRWRKWLFGVMARNASSAADFFQLPPDRVVELGAVIEF